MHVEKPTGSARRFRRLLPVFALVCALLQATVVLGLTRLVADEVSPTAGTAANGPESASGTPQDAEERRAEARRTAVEALLERRGAAVLARDRAAFLDTVDPFAQDYRRAQAESFDNSAEIPFDSFGYTLTTSDAFDPGDARRVASAAPLFTAQVALAYRVSGYDAAPVRATQYLTFVLRSGAWYLAADDDGAAHGKVTTPQLWDLGHVTVVHGENSIVLGLGTAGELGGYAREADLAVPEVTAVWGTEWARRALVIVPGTRAQMARLLGSDPARYARIAAVTTGERGAAVTAAAADRVIVNPEAFRELGDLERRVVMTHEITHVASRAYTRSWTPTWLSEGFADYVGYLPSGQTMRTAAPELRRDVRAGRVPGELPDDERFGTTEENLPQAYEMGWLACRLIAERWGEEALVALYRTIGAAPVPGTGAPDQASVLAAAMDSVLGTDPVTFTEAWREYLRSEAG